MCKRSIRLNNIYTSEYVEKPNPDEMKYVTMSIWYSSVDRFGNMNIMK